MISLEFCQHRWAYDPETAELVCVNGCGVSFPEYERREIAYAPAGGRLSSPSVAGHGLGTDQNQVIYELSHNRDQRILDFERKRTTRQLSGAINFLPDGHDKADEDLVVLLADRLSGRVSPDQIAARAEIYRRGLARLNREKHQKALELLNQMVPDDGDGR